MRHAEALTALQRAVEAEKDAVAACGLIAEHLKRYPEDRALLLGGTVEKMVVRAKESIDEGKRTTLRELRMIRDLTEPEFKALAAAMAYFIAAERGGLRMRREELYVSGALTGLMRGLVDEKYVKRLSVVSEVVLAYYLRLDMPQRAQGVFPLSFADEDLSVQITRFIDAPTEEGFEALRSATMKGTYADFKKTRESVEIEMTRRVEEVYAGMGEDLRVARAQRLAGIRTGARIAALAIVVCFACNISVSSLFDLFRQSSKDMARAEIVRVYEEQAAEVMRARVPASAIDSGALAKAKSDLVEELSKLKDKSAAHVDAVHNVYVAPGEDQLEEVAKALSDRAVTARSAEEIGRRIKETVNTDSFAEKAGDLLNNLINSVSGKTTRDTGFSWKEFAAHEKAEYERKVYEHMLALLKDPQFEVALDKDVRSGQIEIVHVDSEAQKYLQAGKVWIQDVAKKTAVEGAWAAFDFFVKDFFVQSFNFCWGEVSHNQQRIDAAEHYFSILATIVLSASVLVAGLFLLGLGFIVTTLVLAVKWTYKLGRLIVHVMVRDQIHDGRVILCTIPVFGDLPLSELTPLKDGERYGWRGLKVKVKVKKVKRVRRLLGKWWNAIRTKAK